MVIKNKPHASKFYGASVAGPVFKEISDRLYTLFVRQDEHYYTAGSLRDTTYGVYAGAKQDVHYVMNKLRLGLTRTKDEAEFVTVVSRGTKAAVTPLNIAKGQMPSLKGLALKDAVQLCENIGLKLAVTGRGKVVSQSIGAGGPVAKGQLINIELR